MAEEEKEVEEPTKSKALTVHEEERARIVKELRKQWNQPWQELAKVIRSDAPLLKPSVDIVLQIARQFMLPIHGVDMISTKQGVKPYVNAVGYAWKLWLDSRGIMKSFGDPIHWPTKDEPWCAAKGYLQMGDGSEFTNYGVVLCAPSGDVANAMKKAITQSKRRTAVDAVGAGLPPVAEDYYEYMQEDQRPVKGPTIEGAFTVVPATITEPTNLAELLAWAGKFGKTMDDAVAVVGDIMQITDFPATVKKLREAWKEDIQRVSAANREAQKL